MKFGTSGVRGLVIDLQGYPSALYATAFARHLLKSGAAKAGDRIFVSGDYRPSSPDIAATCISALAQAGLTPVDCGALPTPALALYAMGQGGAALMVTGSHIPADRNGIKFYRPDGEIDKNDEQQITRIVTGMQGQAINLAPHQAASEQSQAAKLFRDRNAVCLPAGALAGLKVGVYQHSTVARDLLVEVLSGYGATVFPLGRSDDFIPVDTEAVSPETIDLLRGWTREHALDAIVSADGDGDRPLVSDETGAPLRGDMLGLIVAQFLDAKVVVTPVTSNSGIEDAGAYQVVRTKVGSPFVIEGMIEAAKSGQSNVMGFEANGGVLTQSDFALSGGVLSALPTRDSFLPILATLLRAKQEAKPLSSIASAFGLPTAAADRLENFTVESSVRLMTHLRASPQNLAAFLAPLGAITSISDLDGLRITLADSSIVHLRPSGNAPEMRCYVEASDEAAAVALLGRALATIRDWAGSE